MLWRGAPWQVLRLAESGRIAIWATAGIMQEVQDTLSYPPAASDVVDTYSDT